MKTARYVLTAALIFAPAAAFAAHPVIAAPPTHAPVIHDHAPQPRIRTVDMHR